MPRRTDRPSPRVTSQTEPSLTDLVEGALAGERRDWERLVDRLSALVWRVVGSFQMNDADREDAYASTFYRLYDKLASVKEPEALPGWISTTARNEVYNLLRVRNKSIPMDDLPLREIDLTAVDEALLDDELIAAALLAFAGLPPKGQALLRATTAVPPLSYNEISRLLDMPKGSIGPMRAHYLRKLRTGLQPYLTNGGRTQ